VWQGTYPTPKQLMHAYGDISRKRQEDKHQQHAATTTRLFKKRVFMISQRGRATENPTKSDNPLSEGIPTWHILFYLKIESLN